MIIFRYLIKEILTTLLASTAVLLLIFMSTQFVHYLSAAAIGKYSAQILMHIMLLQIPYLLGLLIPAGLYMAILLAFGRLYTDHEMVVLFSCGMSQKRLVATTMSLAAVVMIIVAFLNLWIGPIIATKQKLIMAEAKAAPLIEAILPGQFLAADNGRNVFYLKSISRDRTQMHNIFIAEMPNNQPDWTVMAAERGYQMTDNQGQHFIVIVNGQRYAGMPGQSNFQIDKFGHYYLKVDTANPVIKMDEQTMSTPTLLKAVNHNPNAEAEWQWRLSMPISVLVLALLAVPLSKVDPRQGRYAQLLPAIIIYVLYANTMFLVRTWLQENTFPSWLGLWWLHGCLLLLALALLFWQSGATSRFKTAS